MKFTKQLGLEYLFVERLGRRLPRRYGVYQTTIQTDGYWPSLCDVFRELWGD